MQKIKNENTEWKSVNIGIILYRHFAKMIIFRVVNFIMKVATFLLCFLKKLEKLYLFLLIF